MQPLDPRPYLHQRRQALMAQIGDPLILWSGAPPARNFPANVYPFRANSHFLYFAGYHLKRAALRFAEGQVELYWDEPSPESALWHGTLPSRSQLAAQMGIAAHYPLAALTNKTLGAATLPCSNRCTQIEQEQYLGRPIGLHHPQDRALATAIVHLRLHQDPLALAEIRHAIAVTIAAHRAGLAATPRSTQVRQVRAAMESTIAAHGCECAYTSIVTTQGEILHKEASEAEMPAGGLILADVGAESPRGWAADLTRTWPVSGKFSPPQRDLYEIVLQTHDRCIAALKPGVEYRDIHLLGCHVLAAGLVNLGILRGHPEDLVAQDIPALFFPHGIGHLLGLDVHDMEDLGDLAGYAPQRQRSPRPGLKYLRLDRPLAPDMVVTIEPGFYQVPALLKPARQNPSLQEWISWEKLDQLNAESWVRGIRLENDIRITPTGAEILSQDLPTTPAALEDLLNQE